MSENLPAIPAEEIKEIMQSAPQTLQMNRDSVTNSLSYAQKLLDAAALGMSPELDAAIEKYIAKNREAVVACYNRRSPITKKFDDIRTVFTELENSISLKNAKSLPSQLQVLRDKYAAQRVEERRKKEVEEQKRLDYENAKIDARAKCAVAFIGHIEDTIAAAERKLQNTLTYLTIDTIGTTPMVVAGISDLLEPASIHEFSFTAPITQQDLADITVTVVREKVDEMKLKYQSRISEAKRKFNEQLPGRIADLKELKAKLEQADADEKARLQREAEQRNAELKAAADKAAADKAAAEKYKAEQEAEAQKAREEIVAKFESHVEMAGAEQVKAKVSLDIRVTTPMAYLHIVSRYFQLEGCNKTPEELEKVTLTKMRSVCAKDANNGGAQIVASGIEYFESVKAK